MRQHGYSWLLGPYNFNRVETIHVANPIDYRINLLLKSFAIFQGPFTCADFNFPTRIEVISAREDDIGMLQVQLSGETHQGSERIANERWMSALR